MTDTAELERLWWQAPVHLRVLVERQHAAKVERLRAERDRLREALRNLLDVHDGHSENFLSCDRAAIAQARAALGEDAT